MKLQKRIKKIEKEISVGEYCACPDTNKIEVIFEGVNDYSSQNRLVPERCDKCGRPILKQTLIVEYV